MIKGAILLFLFGVFLVTSALPVPDEEVAPIITQQSDGEVVPIITQQSDGEVVPIITQESDIQPDGQYSYGYESGDGTAQEQTGTLKVVDDVSVVGIEGRYSYKDPEGNSHFVTYTADENGFQPVGDDIPQPPPLPEIIARALKYIEEHPYVEEKNT